MTQEYTYRSMQDQPEVLQLLDELSQKHGDLIITITPVAGAYSTKQRGALHVACKELSEVLNSGGFDMQAVLKPGTEIAWTPHSVKENLYKPVLLAMEGKASTEDMTSAEPGKVWAVVCRHLSSKLGITPPAWPSNRGPQ
jgi:hypothetical protein